MVFVNHGESSVVDFFAAKIKADLGFEAFAPHSGTAFDLLSNSFVKVTKGIPVKPRAAVSRSPVFARLLATGEKLLDVSKESEGMANKELAKFADQLDALIVKWRN